MEKIELNWNTLFAIATFAMAYLKENEGKEIIREDKELIKTKLNEIKNLSLGRAGKFIIEEVM